MTTAVKEKKYDRRLTDYERETIVNFNREESIAHIFTYEKTWQKHLELRLGLKPVLDNGYGGREYQLPKALITPPRAKRQYSQETRQKLVARLARMRGKQKPLFEIPTTS
jgi:hypothetical protein